MKKIVNVQEASKHYLDGKKVRRYITDEFHTIAMKKAHSEGRRFNSKNSWKGVWLWLDKDGKRCSNISKQAMTYDDYIELPDDDSFPRVFSPLESIEKLGFGYDKDKKWEVLI